MQKQFDTILDFTKLRDKCLFCEGSLRVRLTNYLNPLEGGLLPVLDAPVENGRFTFQIKHTTQDFDIKADGLIDITNNTLFFTLLSGSDLLDQYVAKQAFMEFKPHIELICNRNKCKNKYVLSTYSMDIKRSFNANVWHISPLKLFLESFKTNTVVIQNNWMKEETVIYSRLNENAEPLKVPFMNFEEMGPEKLLNRIKTIIIFS